MEEGKMIYGALIKAQTKVPEVAKNQRHFKNWQFRGIEDFMNTLHPVLSECGIGTLPMEPEVKVEKREYTGKVGYFATVKIQFFLFCQDGSNLIGGIVGDGYDAAFDGSAVSKALADAYKKFWEFTLHIPTEKQLNAADQNGYTDSLMKEERTPVAPNPARAQPSQDMVSFQNMVKWGSKEYRAQDQFAPPNYIKALQSSDLGNKEKFLEVTVRMLEKGYVNKNVKKVLSKFTAQHGTPKLP